MKIELYTSAAEIVRLEALIEASPQPIDPMALVALAWGLRQRNVARAAELVLVAENNLELLPINTVEKLQIEGRIALIRAEASWLVGEMDAAEEQLGLCTAVFKDANDLCGQGDTLLLHSFLKFDRGLMNQRLELLREAAELYRIVADVPRARICDAWSALDASFGGDRKPLCHLQELVAETTPASLELVEGLLKFAEAQLAFMEGAYGDAVGLFEAAADCLAQYGVLRQSIAARVNATGALGNLGQFERQADAMEAVLRLARPIGWPLSIAACLYMLGDANHSLGRLETARAAFVEARERLQGFRSSRVFVVVTTFLGEVNLRLGLIAEAFEALEDARIAAVQGGHAGLLQRTQIALATCLAELGQTEQAAEILHKVLNATDGLDLVTERLALLALAELHSANELAHPDGISAPTAELHYLDQAWALQAKDPNWIPDEAFLAKFGAAWERVGDLRKALDYERRRTTAIATESNQRAQRQLAASQSQQEADAACREADHQRRLAEEERERLAVLNRLSLIGQEITTSLDSVEVIQIVDRHVNLMLDATVLSLWLLEENILMPVFIHEAGLPVKGRTIALDDPNSSAAATARGRCETLLEYQLGEISPLTVPGARPMLTTLFVPLVVGQRLLGVMSIQSPRIRAYGERERLIFRSICAYSAIAIGNAVHYQLLNSSHEKLLEIQAELRQLASTDPLTGLYNRRHLMHQAEAEIGRARRTGLPLSLFLLDLDHFKRINDTFGHASGDSALCAVSDALLKTRRPSDIISRYGGEEIVGLLPETDALGAFTLAERIRETVMSAMSNIGEVRFSLTGSIGVSAWAAHEPTIEQALARADKALYRVKADGRNAVKIG